MALEDILNTLQAEAEQEIGKINKQAEKELAELNLQIGNEVLEMVIAVLDDFEKTRVHITEITNLRRNVREKQWELQKMNYDYQEDFLAFRYTETLIKYLMETADRAEIFADRVFILINKYAP